MDDTYRTNNNNTKNNSIDRDTFYIKHSRQSNSDDVLFGFCLVLNDGMACLR
jgi:hypothetical protein